MTERVITTPRLDLLLLPVHLLHALRAKGGAGQPRPAMAAPFAVPASLELRDSLVDYRTRQIEQEPAVRPWLVRAVVLRATRVMVGHAGFHAAPGSEHLLWIGPRAVELGYQIDAEYRRQGYATEAAVALMREAYEQDQVRQFVLSISPDNQASLRMADKLGFEQVGTQQDDIDGLELVLARTVDRFPPEWLEPLGTAAS